MYFIGSSIIKDTEIAPLSSQRMTGEDGEVYEMLRIENGKPLFLSDHLARFRASIAAARMNLPAIFDKLPSMIEWLILCNGIVDNDLRLCLSRDGLFQGGFVASHYPTREQYANGIECRLLNAQREQPTAKIYHAEMRTKAMQQQTKDCIFETLLVDKDGYITEGSRSNVFFVKGDTLFDVPADRILHGIIRDKVLQICMQQNIKVTSEAVHSEHMADYDACFITSTPMRILPVAAVEKCKFDVHNTLLTTLMSALDKEIASQLK